MLAFAKKCYYCAEKIPQEAKFCPCCGKSLFDPYVKCPRCIITEPFIVEDPYFGYAHCSSCNAIIGRRMHFCPACGAANNNDLDFHFFSRSGRPKASGKAAASSGAAPKASAAKQPACAAKEAKSTTQPSAKETEARPQKQTFFNECFAVQDAPPYVPDAADIEKYRRAAEIFFRHTPDEAAPAERKAQALAGFAAMFNAIKNRRAADFSAIAAIENETKCEEQDGVTLLSRCAAVTAYYGTQSCYDGGCCGADEVHERKILFCMEEKQLPALEWNKYDADENSCASYFGEYLPCFRFTATFDLGKEMKFSMPKGTYDYYYFYKEQKACAKRDGGVTLLLNHPFGLAGCYGLAYGCYFIEAY